MSGEKPELLRKGRAKAGAATLAEFALRPDPADPRLTERVSGLDQDGRAVETAVVVERPLTLFLNGQEIVTMMTIGDYPDYLAVGYLLNQNMLKPRSEEHTSELQSLMRISYAVFCLKKKQKTLKY